MPTRKKVPANRTKAAETAVAAAPPPAPIQPAVPVIPCTPEAIEAALGNGRGHKRVVDWSKTPYAIFKSKRGVPLMACATKAEVIAEIQKLPVSVQERIFVGEVKPIKIKTEIVM